MNTGPALLAAALAVLAFGAAARADDFPVVQTEDGFLDVCEQEWVQREPTAAAWARDECRVRWDWATAAAPLADAILAMSSGASTPARAMPDDILASPGKTGLRFDWEEEGVEGRYNVTGALRSRGIALKSLGCPEYPGVSMGREKVALATPPGGKPFVLTVYSRAAPTGFEPAVYEVDADFSGVVPDMAALEAGHYPGGGGRAFAVDPTGWVAECPDPE